MTWFSNKEFLFIAIGIFIVTLSVSLTLTEYRISEERKDMQNQLSAMQTQHRYTSQMMYGVHDELAISGIYLFPNQIKKDQSSVLIVEIENDTDETKNYTIEISPFNTDYIVIEPQQTHTTVLEPQQSEKLVFNVTAINHAGTYFTTWLDVIIYGDELKVLDSEKVFFVVTTNYVDSMEELKFLGFKYG